MPSLPGARYSILPKKGNDYITNDCTFSHLKNVYFCMNEVLSYFVLIQTDMLLTLIVNWQA
jgi:hypothetical protein